MQDEFSQKRRYIHDEAFAWQNFDKLLGKVKSPHRHLTGHFNRMNDPSWNPNSSEGWNNPNPIPGLNCHDAVASKNQLVFVVKMVFYKFPISVVPRKCRQLSFRVPMGIKSDAMTFFRHILSQY